MKELFHRISWRSVITFTLFIILATAMWYGHAMQSVRNTHVPVHIVYTGKPSAIGLGEEGLPDEVMIEVRDIGARLNSYHRDPLQLTIDLRSYIHGEKGTIHVPSDALRRGISDILQGTSRLIETHPEEIRCTYFTEQEKSVVLAFAGSITPAMGYQISVPPQLNKKRVKIYGQDKKLAEIDTIYTEALAITDLSDTLQSDIALVAPAGIRTEFDSVGFKVAAEQFTEKKFILPIRVTGVPEGCHIRLFPAVVEVSVRMGMSHFAKVQQNDIRVECHYSAEQQDKMDVEIRYTNPYITSAWVYPGAVEFILEQ